MPEETLFNSADIFSFGENQKRRLLVQIDAIEPDRLMDSSVAGGLAAYFTDMFAMRVPTLNVNDALADQHEGEVLAHDVFQERAFRTIGTIVEVTIPFEGDGSMFGLRANTWGGMAISAEVKEQELTIRVAGRGLASGEVKREFDRRIAAINEKLTWLRADARAFNAELPGLARRRIEERRSKLLADQNLVADLGFKLKRRPDAPTTYAVPLARRRIVPQLPAVSAAPLKPEPTLAEDDYRNILSVMENMALVMERSPSAFEAIKEEDLRVHFLVQLNGQYEGQATGETFNFQGKTDILVRSDNKNIFIAECKYWHGAKGHSETIDQVLSYLSWRDTKAAIVVFNRNKNFTKILEEIKTATSAHSLRKSGPKVESETRFRYVFGQQADHSRDVTLTILAFDVPTP